MLRALSKCAVAGALALVGSGAVQAAQTSTLYIPPVNEMTVGVYGDFYVYSLELLDKCQSAGDSRCYYDATTSPVTLSGPWPDASNTATIGNYVLIYKNSQGNSQNNYIAPTYPLTGTQTVDNPFDSVTGTTSTFDTNTAGEPGEGANNYGDTTPEFTGDIIGKWDASLATIYQFLNGGELFFFFGNNQEGDGIDQVQYLWAQVTLTNPTGDPLGVAGKCWELNSTFVSPGPSGDLTLGTGCINDPTVTDTTDPKYVKYDGVGNPVLSGDYVGTGGAFCVDKVTGDSYVPVSGGVPNYPGKDADCTVTAANASDGQDHSDGGYFISNNLGQNSTEFAAFLPELNANLEAWAGAGYFMSIQFQVRNLNDGGDQLWIRSVGVPVTLVSEPATLALLGVGLFAAAGVARRRRAS